MKKTVTINLAGRIYNIDEDAFELLHNYLEGIREALKQTEGSQEIYEDIEARIAELLNEKLRNRQVVIISDIRDIISLMGEPNDISGDTGQKSSYHHYRRMYRDPDNSMIGGVCSGLAAYWRMDPTLVRVIFIILAVFGMAGILIYLILWILLPEAHTVAQKLEMRGEPVNFSSIRDFFAEEFENVKRSFRKK